MSATEIDAWVSRTFQIDVTAYPPQAPAPRSGAAGKAPSAQADTLVSTRPAAAALTEGLTIPGVPIPIPLPDLTKHCIVKGKLLNNTGQTLRLDPPKPKPPAAT